MSELENFLLAGRTETLPVFGNDWDISQTATPNLIKGVFLLLGAVSDENNVNGKRKRAQEAEITFLRSESLALKEDNIITLDSTGEKWVIIAPSKVDSVDIVFTIHSNVEFKRGGQ